MKERHHKKDKQEEQKKKDDIKDIENTEEHEE